MSWCERKGVDYIIGIGTNSRLEKLALPPLYRAAMQMKATWKKQRCFATVRYAAHSWKKRERKVIVKAELSEKGKNLRFVVTNLQGAAQVVIRQVLLHARRYGKPDQRAVMAVL